MLKHGASPLATRWSWEECAPGRGKRQLYLRLIRRGGSAGLLTGLRPCLPG
ncbi:hypothetical protein I603_1484 [Erythrobacter dokdonensis DSW-74]|uniref:Uncharacterized protein n=1 Tax=Erythrobacter dokdonensis DSW-74 TaxID=1300349 RepID=A0A1A7BH78_9SPHN|nr:hypothetical protein I603_1484 [Erythrobacter dokdonensis DSW-74]